MAIHFLSLCTAATVKTNQTLLASGMINKEQGVFGLCLRVATEHKNVVGDERREAINSRVCLKGNNSVLILLV